MDDFIRLHKSIDDIAEAGAKLDKAKFRLNGLQDQKLYEVIDQISDIQCLLKLVDKKLKELA